MLPTIMPRAPTNPYGLGSARSQRPKKEHGCHQDEAEERDPCGAVQGAVAIMHCSDEEVAVACCTDEGGGYDDEVLCGEAHAAGHHCGQSWLRKRQRATSSPVWKSRTRR